MKTLSPGEVYNAQPYIIWLEPRRSYAPLAPLLESLHSNSIIFIASHAHSLQLHQELAGSKFSATILPFNVPQPEQDDVVYEAASIAAEAFTTNLLRALTPVIANEDRGVLKPLLNHVTDCFAPRLKALYAFARLMKEHPEYPAILLNTSASLLNEHFECLAPDLQARVHVISDLTPTPAKYVPADLADMARTTAIRTYDPAELADALQSTDIVFAGTFRQIYYQRNCEQFVETLAERYRVTVLLPMAGSLEDLNGSSLRDRAVRGNIKVLFANATPPVQLPPAILRVVTRCRNSVAKRLPRIKLPTGIIDINPAIIPALDKHIVRTLHLCMPLNKLALANMAGVKAVVASPGRYLANGVMIAAANHLGIPTIEMQGATVAPTKRFFKPDAAHVLAVDHLSGDLYTTYFKCAADTVHVAGSVHADQTVLAARGLTKEAAKTSVGLAELDLNGRPLPLVVTQPIGVERATVFMATCLTAIAARKLRHVVIKVHPSEGEEYLTRYRDLAARFEDIKVVIARSGDAATYLKACDIAITHFSTMGLEAFALGLPVVALNPFPAPLPYDLVKLGVAVSASNAKDLVECLLQIETSATPHFYATMPGLNLLKDGKTMERIANVIEGLMARPKPVPTVES